MARPTIRDNGVPLTPGERQQRWRKMKRLRKLSELADKMEDMGYDAAKRDEYREQMECVYRSFPELKPADWDNGR